MRLRATYGNTPLDEWFEPVRVVLEQDLLAPTARHAIPAVTADVPLEIDAAMLRKADVNRALSLDGDGDCVRVDAGAVALPQGPLTLECWLRARRFGERVGLVAKTESSEYGIFVSGGRPDASVFLGGTYRAVRPDIVLDPGRWYHLAMVYDGAAVTFHVDGRAVGRTEVDPAAQRKPNRLPLFIGADTDKEGRPTSFFEGEIDEVHLARVAKYRGDFVPSRRLDPEEGTVFLYDFDRRIGPLVLDRGRMGGHARLVGDACLVDVDPVAAP